MKAELKRVQARVFRMVCAVALGMGTSFGLATADSPDTAPAKTAIPWSQIGAKAGADYQGDGAAVIPSAAGARLRCVFQRLEGEATSEGLWLTSTVTNAMKDRFRVTATAVGRTGEAFGVPASAGGASESYQRSRLTAAEPAKAGTPNHLFPRTGTVEVADQLARFVRPGLTEEYTVSMNGVRQDFIVEQRPAGAGELRVELDVAGAKVEPLADGARLVLENSGRKIAYSRLRVTDALGKELTARMEVPAKSEISLVVLVNDADAVYPVRIDPTFSDANWISMGGVPGADLWVSATVVDGSGNLYIGGRFTVVGDVIANHVAKWDGSSWSALGLGMNDGVFALAVSGSDLYAGGWFTTAGGSAANYIAKWNGSSWSALGSGMNGGVIALAVSGSDVYAAAGNSVAKWNGSSWSALGSAMGGVAFPYVTALAVSGGDLYAGGVFTTAGGSAAKNIAKWNGSSWSALGSGMNEAVRALAVSSSDLYAGGEFTVAGDTAAKNIAKWNGSSWSALGSGMNGVSALAVSGSDVYAGGLNIAKWNGSSWSAVGSRISHVYALAVSGSDLYAGGDFTTAGDSAANYIAKWNGSSWSALGSGINYGVLALVVSGGDLYVGGGFETAGGSAANRIAKWNGSTWTALGSGMGASVMALAVSGSNVYAGGWFTTAGDSVAHYIAQWNGSTWTALGSGMDAPVNALAVSGSNVYAGGYFTIAAAMLPITSPNGTGAVGRRWAQG